MINSCANDWEIENARKTDLQYFRTFMKIRPTSVSTRSSARGPNEPTAFLSDLPTVISWRLGVSFCSKGRITCTSSIANDLESDLRNQFDQTLKNEWTLSLNHSFSPITPHPCGLSSSIKNQGLVSSFIFKLWGFLQPIGSAISKEKSPSACRTEILLI